MIKKYWFVIILVGILTACNSDEEPICSVCEIFPGNYITNVTYSEWEALYDTNGEFISWEYYENLSTINEIEVILTDYESSSFQLKGLYNSFLEDIPASLDGNNQRLKFDYEITRSGNNYRVLKGYATFSNDSLFIESTLNEFGYYFPGTETFESYISETGVKQ